jgi:hypothetical protein
MHIWIIKEKKNKKQMTCIMMIKLIRYLFSNFLGPST